LSNGYIVRVTARDAATGALVPAVIVSNVSIGVDPEETTAPETTQEPGEIFLIPGPAMPV
jgi:hypothetical protein